MRRAFTLIEVVAATALLALIVLACVPLLRGTARDLAARDGGESLLPRHSLERAVDELLIQRPGLLGQILEQPDGVLVEWVADEEPHTATASLIALRREGPVNARTSHAWVCFSTESAEVIRWLRAPGGAGETGDGA